MFSREMFRNRINLDNPWWETGRVDAMYYAVKPRMFLDKFYQYLKLDDLHRSIVLMGPRRVGKTWLIQHAIARLLAEGDIPARNILLLPIDVPVYHGSELEELMYEAGKISGANPRTDRMVVFFDEIQYKKDWEVALKTLTDSYPNIRFAASGSAASVLAKGAKESGAGRFTELKISALTFYEYMDMAGLGEDVFESMERTNACFIDYLNFGGYPELVASREARNDPRQFIQRDIIDKVLLRDLPSLYHIDDVRDLQSLFSYVAFHSGMVQSYEVLAQASGLSKYTIANMLQYLEEAFLIVRHERVDVNALSMKRATQFKLYLTNPSLRAAMFQPVGTDDIVYLGHAVETAISAQLGIGEGRNDWKYANWRVGKEQREVDFVRIDPGTQRPEAAMEVKWTDGPFDHPAEIKEAVAFVKNNGMQNLTVTSRTQAGRKYYGEVELTFVPTARVAYDLGRRMFAK